MTGPLSFPGVKFVATKKCGSDQLNLLGTDRVYRQCAKKYLDDSNVVSLCRKYQMYRVHYLIVIWIKFPFPTTCYISYGKVKVDIISLILKRLQICSYCSNNSWRRFFICCKYNFCSKLNKKINTAKVRWLPNKWEKVFNFYSLPNKRFFFKFFLFIFLRLFFWFPNDFHWKFFLLFLPKSFCYLN